MLKLLNQKVFGGEEIWITVLSEGGPRLLHNL